jgi:predicted peroxiredoxin
MAGKAVISLSTGLEDSEKVTVAFLVAVGAAESGRPTLMFQTKEAVRLAMEGVAAGVACDGCPPLQDLLARYEKAGGQFMVCPICFNAKRLERRAAAQRGTGWHRRAVGVDRRRRGDHLQLLTGASGRGPSAASLGSRPDGDLGRIWRDGHHPLPGRQPGHPDPQAQRLTQGPESRRHLAATFSRSINNKVATVTGHAGIACVAMCGCLHDERTDEVWPPDASFPAADGHRHDLAALQRLGPACGWQSRAAGNALAFAGPLPTPSGSSTSIDAWPRTQRCWRPSAEIPADVNPMPVSALVNVRNMSGSARTSITASTSLVGRTGNWPRSAQYRWTSCPPIRVQPLPRWS